MRFAARARYSRSSAVPPLHARVTARTESAGEEAVGTAVKRKGARAQRGATRRGRVAAQGSTGTGADGRVPSLQQPLHAGSMSIRMNLPSHRRRREGRRSSRMFHTRGQCQWRIIFESCFEAVRPSATTGGSTPPRSTWAARGGQKSVRQQAKRLRNTCDRCDELCQVCSWQADEWWTPHGSECHVMRHAPTMACHAVARSRVRSDGRGRCRTHISGSIDSMGSSPVVHTRHESHCSLCILCWPRRD